MHDLIKIENTPIGSESVPTVNARELHEFLGVSTKFNTWIKRRIEECRLLENRDYIWVTQSWETQTSQGKLGVATQKVVILSIDAAKHVAMIERTDRGFEVRDYFIECEKKLHKIVSAKQNFLLNIISAEDDLSRALAVNAYEVGYVKPLEQFKEQALPKVSYHDKVLNSPDLVNISQIAKDYPISAVKLNKILQEEGVQYKDKKGEWTLYAKYKDKGYASTKTQVIKNGEYEVLKVHLKWTQRGRLFIYDLLKSKGILPICEQP